MPLKYETWGSSIFVGEAFASFNKYLVRSYKGNS